MAEEIGKIEKPPAEDFKRKRKVYLVPLVYPSEGAPTEYEGKCHLYWQQVEDQLNNLEAKVGKIARVYHESISQSGEDAMKTVERLNSDSYQIVKSRCDNGAVFEAIEEEELLVEAMDWERCLLLGFMSQRVASKVAQFYSEAAKKRYESMAKKMDETLKDNEAGLLFIREEYRLQLPQDIEVFSVFPPALDEIHRWLRDYTEAEKEEKAKD
jgi:hypothetical protein